MGKHAFTLFKLLCIMYQKSGVILTPTSSEGLRDSKRKTQQVKELHIRAVFGSLPLSKSKVRKPKISRADGSDGYAV
jgi:hypothetical protein